MTRYQYQGTPPKPPAPNVAIVSGTLSSDKAGVYSFWLQYRNRAGYSQVSNRVTRTLSANQGVAVTIPANALPDPNGCCIWEYVLLMGRTSNPQEACVVATQPGFQADQITVIQPGVITLTLDEDFELFKTVDTAASLPANAANGARRYVEQTNEIVAWNAGALNWLAVTPAQFNTYISSDLGDRGANEDLSAIEDLSTIVVPSYSSDAGGEGVPVGYWLVNNGTTNIAAGTRIGMTVEWNGVDVSTLSGIVGGLNLRFLGYVNILTGVLETSGEGGIGTMPLIGEVIEYQGPQTGLVLPKALPPNYAYVLTVAPNLKAALLGGRLSRGSTLSFSPEFYADFATYTPDDVFGSYIGAKAKRRRIVPDLGLSAIALPGSGAISLSTGGAMKFEGLESQIVPSLSADTSNQKVAISINGTCFIVTTVPNAAELRAIIGTLDGVGQATGWSGNIALDTGKTLSVQLTYPTAIRADYPDVVANSGDGRFNAGWVRIYVKSVATGDITYYEVLVTPDSPSDTFVVGALAGTTASALPTRPSPDFGLYEPSLSSAVLQSTTGASVFAAGNYQVAIAFRFANTVTSISHDPLRGCIFEASGSATDLFRRSQYWAEAVLDTAGLRSLDEATIFPHQVRYVANRNNPYRFDPTSMAVDDGSANSSVVRPNYIASNQPGRFIEDSSAAWYAGEEEPGTGLGQVRDFYFRSDGRIYEKTSATVWTQRIRVAQMLWLNGSGAPASDLGFQNDCYIDDSTGEYYRKTSGGWVLQGRLRIDWYNEYRIPTSSDGKVGDFFINNNTGYLYRKISSTVWDFRANLKGAAGDRGASILSGIGSPDDAIGRNEDLYLDRESFNLYVKASDTWGSPVSNLQGGNAFLVGTTDPSNAVGRDQDVYFNRVNFNLYLKSGGIWGEPLTNLKGGGAFLTGTVPPDPADGYETDVFLNRSTGLLYKKADTGWVQIYDFTSSGGGGGGDGGGGGSSGFVNLSPDVDNAFTIDCSLGSQFLATLVPGADNTILATNVTEGQSFVLHVGWQPSTGEGAVNPKSLLFSNDFVWLDGPPRPDFNLTPGIESNVYRIEGTCLQRSTLGVSGFACCYTPRPIRDSVQSTFEDETRSLLATFTGYYSDRHQIRLNALIKGLKDAGLWNKLTWLNLYAAGSLDDARRNWISPSANMVEATLNPFQRWKGLTTNTPINLGTFSNSGVATIGVWSLTDDAIDGVDLGVSDNSGQTTELSVRNTSNEMSGRVLSSDSIVTASSSTGRGLFVAAKVTPTVGTRDIELYRNGVLQGSGSATVTGSTGGLEFTLGGRRNSVSSVSNTITRQYAAMFVANTLSGSEQLTLFNLVKAYLLPIVDSFDLGV